MILTVEQTKDFFRANKGAIKGTNVIYRYGRNQMPTRTLRESGAMLLELAESTELFSLSSFNGEAKIESLEHLATMLENNEIDCFVIEPHHGLSHAEQMGAKMHGRLD